jgi:hypothetical protein
MSEIQEKISFADQKKSFGKRSFTEQLVGARSSFTEQLAKARSSFTEQLAQRSSFADQRAHRSSFTEQPAKVSPSFTQQRAQVSLKLEPSPNIKISNPVSESKGRKFIPQSVKIATQESETVFQRLISGFSSKQVITTRIVWRLSVGIAIMIGASLLTGGTWLAVVGAFSNASWMMVPSILIQALKTAGFRIAQGTSMSELMRMAERNAALKRFLSARLDTKFINRAASRLGFDTSKRDFSVKNVVKTSMVYATATLSGGAIGAGLEIVVSHTSEMTEVAKQVGLRVSNHIFQKTERPTPIYIEQKHASVFETIANNRQVVIAGTIAASVLGLAYGNTEASSAVAKAWIGKLVIDRGISQVIDSSIPIPSHVKTADKILGYLMGERVYTIDNLETMDRTALTEIANSMGIETSKRATLSSIRKAISSRQTQVAQKIRAMITQHVISAIGGAVVAGLSQEMDTPTKGLKAVEAKLTGKQSNDKFMQLGAHLDKRDADIAFADSIKARQSLRGDLRFAELGDAIASREAAMALDAARIAAFDAKMADRLHSPLKYTNDFEMALALKDAHMRQMSIDIPDKVLFNDQVREALKKIEFTPLLEKAAIATAKQTTAYIAGIGWVNSIPALFNAGMDIAETASDISQIVSLVTNPDSPSLSFIDKLDIRGVRLDSLTDVIDNFVKANKINAYTMVADVVKEAINNKWTSRDIAIELGKRIAGIDRAEKFSADTIGWIGDAARKMFS